MHESFLYYVWQFQYFNKSELVTTDGDRVEILSPGYRNTHSGPDFFNSKLKIGDIEWIGSVEIHIYSSEWVRHKHEHDPAYNNVILHVVWTEDKKIKAADYSPLPTLELKHRVSEQLILQYKKLVNNPQSIPCSSLFPQVNSITKLSMFDKALMDRLEVKAKEVTLMLERNNQDWEETTYQLLCRNFGFKVNTDPFQQLSRAIPYKVLMKHADKLIHTEALLFGQAGFLEDESKDDYHALLKREYAVLSRKFDLQSKRMDKVQWRFLRLRPANFPSTRIAQLASLLFHQKKLFSTFVHTRGYNELLTVFSIVQSEYWQHHYQFFRVAEKQVSSLGKQSIDNLIVNTVAPILVAYGKLRDEQQFIDKAVQILEAVPSEKNKIVQLWQNLGVSSKSAFYSQALLELHNNYCLKHRCLDCAIGFSIVQPERK